MQRNESRFFRVPLLVLVFGLGISACSNSVENAGIPAASDHAEPLPELVVVSSKADIEPLFTAIGDRRFVLLGESTHGTHEYYHWRDRISRRLIRDKGFRFVAVEGDWESIFQLNQYVKHRTPEDMDLRSLLRGLDRWPQWMWANEEFAEMLEWMREQNATRSDAERIGVYGLDMQNPQASMDAVVQWFKQNDPDTLAAVKERYRSVHGVPNGFRRYAQSLAQGMSRLQDDFIQVAEWLREHHDQNPRDANLFSAKMNALAVVSAEAQHHAMVHREHSSWNVRARFMDKAFRKLAERYSENSRGIAWAHNTHVGDASATEMVNRGEVNIGQLLRQEFGHDQVYILGFSTAQGTVQAGASWGAPMQSMNIIPPRTGSLEAALQERGLEHVILFFDPEREQQEWNEPMPHRAIGVVYNPPHEAYVMTVPAKRYDALFYIHETRALTPVD